MARQNNKNWSGQTNYKKKYNKRLPKKKEHYLDKFKGATVEVRNGDINGAIRKLKKILENADRPLYTPRGSAGFLNRCRRRLRWVGGFLFVVVYSVGWVPG